MRPHGRLVNAASIASSLTLCIWTDISLFGVTLGVYVVCGLVIGIVLTK
jgi:hypothetical protein